MTETLFSTKALKPCVFHMRSSSWPMLALRHVLGGRRGPMAAAWVSAGLSSRSPDSIKASKTAPRSALLAKAAHPAPVMRRRDPPGPALPTRLPWEALTSQPESDFICVLHL